MKQIPEFKISFKRRHKSTPLINIKGAESAADVCRSLFKDSLEWREEFHVIALSTSNNVIGSFKVSEGGVNYALIDHKILFQFVLLANATRIILTHNHPSGKLQVSRQDEEVTEKIARACKDMTVELLDHIIVTRDGYLSFVEEGLL